MLSHIFHSFTKSWEEPNFSSQIIIAPANQPVIFFGAVPDERSFLFPGLKDKTKIDEPV